MRFMPSPPLRGPPPPRPGRPQGIAMKRHTPKPRGTGHVLKGPSQRQLRAGELIRHALVEVMREEELQDEAMKGVSVTVTEVRLPRDLRPAQVFVEPLGGSREADDRRADEIVSALNRHAKFLRGRLGRASK